MIDAFDYKEPSCALCGGKEFYNPQKDAPISKIPLMRVLQKVDASFAKNDYLEAGRLLEYWTAEAKALNDKQGELSLQSELIGYYRKVGNQTGAFGAIDRALVLIEQLEQSQTVSAATVFLNAATAYKAFGQADKSLPLFENAEKIYLKKLDQSDTRFGGLYNNMALSLVDLKQFDKALITYQKAVSVMKNATEGKIDLAITYVNLAYLYQSMGKDKKQITDCMFEAYNLLNDESNIKNGYYAFVCEKCAPAFLEFGFDIIFNQLKKEAEEIYARA